MGCLRYAGISYGWRVAPYAFILRYFWDVPYIILILDEPMNALDKSGVAEIRELLLRLKGEGKTILIVSHNTEDIRMLCDTVHEMDGGKSAGRTEKPASFTRPILGNT